MDAVQVCGVFRCQERVQERGRDVDRGAGGAQGSDVAFVVNLSLVAESRCVCTKSTQLSAGLGERWAVLPNALSTVWLWAASTSGALDFEAA